MAIEVVGVVGAGVMGTGLGQALAQSGLRVLLVDIAEAILNRAQNTIRNDMRLQRMVNPTPGQESVATIMKRIRFCTDYAPLVEADFVIENVTEKWGVKAEVYGQMDATCAPHCIFAANTSAISITRLASLTHRPSQVLGMHFMNPVPMKPMVEIIRGYHTSDETIATAKELLASMRKESIVVEDMPGFATNRVLMLMINEAIFLVQDRVASPEDIDTLFRSCFGHKMGPLETADLIGLDTILYSIEVLYESYNDDKYRPCPLLRKLVDAGRFGRKSGAGFYTYDNDL